jgi:hypothetical protein
MNKNLKDGKNINNEEYLINKIKPNNELLNNYYFDISKDQNQKNPNIFIANLNNNIENDTDDNISFDILNDSLENDETINNNDEETIKKEADIDQLFTSILYKKRKSLLERNNSIKRKLTIGTSNSKSHKISNLNSCQSTQNQTNKKKNFLEKKNISPKYISEFKNESLINTNSTNNIVQKINKNITFFKNWLSSINLPFYYENFINNDIYNIDQLINISKTKTRQETFSFINSIIKTNKIGHIYRILIKIDIDTGFIDNNISNFLTPKKLPNNQYKNTHINTNTNYSDNELLISGIKNVFCTNQIEERSFIKIFFEKYNIKELCSYFINNGFDIVEYIILQMLSRFPINDYILEKDMHINDDNDRKKILIILNNEVNKIYKFLKSEEYLAYTINRRAKYEDFFLSYNKTNNHFIFKEDDKCDFCPIF